MRLTPPKKVTFWISLILVILGIIGRWLGIDFLAEWSWILVVIGYIILVLGLLLKGF